MAKSSFHQESERTAERASERIRGKKHAWDLESVSLVEWLRAERVKHLYVHEGKDEGIVEVDKAVRLPLVSEREGF